MAPVTPRSHPGRGPHRRQWLPRLRAPSASPAGDPAQSPTGDPRQPRTCGMTVCRRGDGIKVLACSED
ncbi:hypothetical protein LEMLEM_LOCUS2221 [Lemmus lemmus]